MNLEFRCSRLNSKDLLGFVLWELGDKCIAEDSENIERSLLSAAALFPGKGEPVSREISASGSP